MHKEILFIIVLVCLLLSTMGASCDGGPEITVIVEELDTDKDAEEYLTNP